MTDETHYLKRAKAVIQITEIVVSVKRNFILYIFVPVGLYTSRQGVYDCYVVLIVIVVIVMSILVKQKAYRRHTQKQNKM